MPSHHLRGRPPATTTLPVYPPHATERAKAVCGRSMLAVGAARRGGPTAAMARRLSPWRSCRVASPPPRLPHRASPPSARQTDLAKTARASIMPARGGGRFAHRRGAIRGSTAGGSLWDPLTRLGNDSESGHRVRKVRTVQYPSTSLPLQLWKFHGRLSKNSNKAHLAVYTRPHALLLATAPPLQPAGCAYSACCGSCWQHPRTAHRGWCQNAWVSPVFFVSQRRPSLDHGRAPAPAMRDAAGACCPVLVGLDST